MYLFAFYLFVFRFCLKILKIVLYFIIYFNYYLIYLLGDRRKLKILKAVEDIERDELAAERFTRFFYIFTFVLIFC